MKSVFEMLWVKRQREAEERLQRELEELRAAFRALEIKLRVPFEARETDHAPAWGNDDVIKWQEFLRTPTGQRLAQVVNWWSQVEEQKATRCVGRTEYACGSAYGYRNCGEFILNKLSADVRPQQDEDTSAGQGVAPERERNTP